MSMGGIITVVIRGAKELEENLDTLISRSSANVQDVMNAWAIEVNDEQIARAPERSGRLKSSITSGPTGTMSNPAVTLMAEAYYAGWVEGGTRYFEGRHFFMPPILEMLDDLSARIGNIIMEDFDKLNAK